MLRSLRNFTAALIKYRRNKSFAKPQKGPYIDRNLYIKAPEMRVIDEEGENLGVLSKEEALRIARDREQDLILVNPNIEPPLAKIMPWSKYKYEQSKKQKVNKASETKEMWFKPFMEDGDIAYRVKRIEDFLEKGKVKVTMRYVRGADKAKMDDAMKKVLDLVGNGKPEGPVKPQGRHLGVFLVKK